ncbi:MAG: hypothetical protein AB1295_00780 [Candidatus Micrarchaeota archaeon]
MRYLALLAILLLSFGCISQGERTIYENASEPASPSEESVSEPAPAIEVPAIHQESRYQAGGFSFVHPDEMETEDSRGPGSGIFSGTNMISSGQTGELLVVTYLNVSAVYGSNQDKIYKDDPTTAASGFLVADMEQDPVAGLLSSAYDVGEVSTYAIARDGVVADVPFKVRFGDSNKSYSGYAMDMYIPERSLQAKVRIIALDSEQAESIRAGFLLSFRLE